MPASRGCRPNNRDTASTVGLLRLERGGEGLGTLLGSWLKKGEGREDTECESQCDWFQIEKQGEGLLLCPAASPGCWRGAPQVRSRIRQWGLCWRNGCDYRPGGGFLPPSGSCCCCGQNLCANEGALIMIMSPLLSQMSSHLYLQHLLNYKNLNSDLPLGPVHPPTSCETKVGYSLWYQYLAVLKCFSDSFWITSIFSLRYLLFCSFQHAELFKGFHYKMYHICLASTVWTMDRQFFSTVCFWNDVSCWHLNCCLTAEWSSYAF